MNKLILIRGLPGSGKSTLANEIVSSKNNTWAHLETDHYFMKNGIYQFDATKIKTAHQWCQNKTEQFLNGNWNVVVSNTFTQEWELLPYFKIAKKLKIIPNVIITTGNFQNIHSVPVDKLNVMKNRFEWNIDYQQLYNSVD